MTRSLKRKKNVKENDSSSNGDSTEGDGDAQQSEDITNNSKKPKNELSDHADDDNDGDNDDVDDDNDDDNDGDKDDGDDDDEGEGEDIVSNLVKHIYTKFYNLYGGDANVDKLNYLIDIEFIPRSIKSLTQQQEIEWNDDIWTDLGTLYETLTYEFHVNPDYSTENIERLIREHCDSRLPDDDTG